MVIARTLALLAALPMLVLAPARAQDVGGGIQVAPVLIAMSPQRNVSSLRVRNGRDRPVAFEVDVYAWRQAGGEDILEPTSALLAAPGVFEIPAHGEQVLRLGAPAPSADREQAYRIILRELPRPSGPGARLGFALELSLPVFMSPAGARARLESYVEHNAEGSVLVIANAGGGYAQLGPVETSNVGALNAPRYLLAGSSAEIDLPPDAHTVRLRAADASGGLAERSIDVAGSGSALARR